MFKPEIDTQPSRRPKNLAGICFAGRSDIESAIDELMHLATEPYASSLALIASAEIGDTTRYTIMLANTMQTLYKLETTSQKNSMQNNSFKAWMWARILLAADSIDDTNTVIKAQEKLKKLLVEEITENDNFSFFTWAWGYRGSLNQKEYVISKKRMLDNTEILTQRYKTTGNNGTLSDALWAWVLNLQAAAYAGDLKIYGWIKEQLKSITKEESITQAIKTGLLRTKDTNDYPAWAMAKTCYAAIVINDKELYEEMENSLVSSINATLQRNAKAEYVLAMLNHQLAILTAQHLSGKK